MGGVTFSVSLSIESPDLLTLTSIAPIAIQSSSGERPNIVARALPRNTKPVVIISRFESFLKKRSGTINKTPSRKPNSSEPRISPTGFATDRSSDVSPGCCIMFTIAMANPKAIRATASSSATTLSSVSVTGPFALYCLTTIIVAAGAVADAIAPRSIAISILNPVSISTRTTTAVAASPSMTAIIIGIVPTFFR